ncbi:MAG: nitroreductase family deazaflavin-dependent oxidoreductase [Candidatus Binatus sp.]|uniref:nitroreductase family deazaflavin-dependent oxidoreductase n=1 Tax=Candidatus Binatus sp. TaxID=2811406 RepID=UPI0027220889|nr:nitroreductase family deazaflavin-dependent oxidoreductase [Candidatus Binatus sp.]MDO8432126.1 nitroreductase family deazaflavin-dependent oxidoreductase [Candidatus Binatus sp.]
MASKAFERLARVENRQTLCLTHYGRKTGRPYDVTIWYLVDDGKLYVVTANANRNWVRNVKARPAISLRIGHEIFNGEVRAIVDRNEREHVTALVERKYWFVMPMLRLGRMLSAIGIVRDSSAAFEVILSEN